MPLKGGGKRNMGDNISTLVREGYPQAQAVAISARKAGLPRPKKKAKR